MGVQTELEKQPPGHRIGAADGYQKDEFVICSSYAKDYPHPDYAADDDSFSAIWKGCFMEFDHENRILTYSAYNDQYQLVVMTFEYSGW